MPFSYEEFDLSGVRTYPLESRASKARVEDFARPRAAAASRSARSSTSLPNMLAAADFKAVVARDRRRAGATARASSGASART